MPLALLDTNVLIHAAYSKSAQHAVAADLLNRGLEQTGLFCIAPQNLIEFAAVASRARFVNPPLPASELGRMCDLLYRSRKLAKIYPHRGTVSRAIREGAAIGVAGPRWHDLFLAMTMRDSGVEVIITENTGDFAQFPFISARSMHEMAGGGSGGR